MPLRTTSRAARARTNHEKGAATCAWEQRDALAHSVYRGIRTRKAVVVQRGIGDGDAAQILTFGPSWGL